MDRPHTLKGISGGQFRGQHSGSWHADQSGDNSGLPAIPQLTLLQPPTEQPRESLVRVVTP